MNDYDVIIIGAGPSGLTAGIYSARALAKTLVLERIAPGGLAGLAGLIENYPGFPEGIDGMGLMERVAKQAEMYGLELKKEEAQKIEIVSEKERIVRTKEGNEYKGAALIIATGTRPKSLGIPGEENFVGKGVSYCATCDAPLFRGKRVVVVGGGDSAVEEALHLSKFAYKTTLIHRRGKLRATGILQERLISQQGLEILLNSVVTEILGSDQVERVRIKNVESGEEIEIPANGVFIHVGLTPNSELVRGFVDTDGDGFIITDEKMETSLKGLFACGDVRSKSLRQIVTACGEGAVAGFFASRYAERWKEG